jgi:hypothetical protein
MEVSGQLHALVALLLGENSPPFLLDRRLGEPQNRSGRYEEEKNLALVGNRTPAVQIVTCRYTD